MTSQPRWSQVQQEAMGFAIARNACRDLNVDWAGHGQYWYELLADYGDKYLAQERSERADAGEDPPVVVPFVPRYCGTRLSRFWPGDEGVSPG